MAINYYGDQIKEHEKLTNGPFIGYINPQGQIIDYSLIWGVPGHDNWRNPVTPYFLNYISYVVLGESIIFFKENAYKGGIYKTIYEDNKYDGFNDIVLRGLTTLGINDTDYESFINSLKNTINNVKEQRTINNEWDTLKYDILSFFEKCYSKRDFFYSLGRVIKVQNKKEIIDVAYKELLEGFSDFGKKSFYRDYCIVTLMSHFKDILVQYLGYDSIERAIPSDDLFIVNNLYDNSRGYKFSKKSTISSSCNNPNERFFNWILMDWDIQKVPRMIWNEQEKRFIEENPIKDYYQSEKEIILGKEIETIKKEVPKQYRKEFFRY